MFGHEDYIKYRRKRIFLILRQGRSVVQYAVFP